MKIIAPLILVLALFLESCNRKDQTTDIIYEKVAGLWVPYEVISMDGTINSGPFSSSTIFGIYAESVKLNTDQHYIPASWISPTSYVLKTSEQGNYRFTAGNQRIIFEQQNGFSMDFLVARYEGNELWLNLSGTLYKLKKEL